MKVLSSISTWNDIFSLRIIVISVVIQLSDQKEQWKFCNPEFDKETIYDGLCGELPVSNGEGLSFKWF